MNAPLFSIIIPTYNAAETLVTTLESIVKQTFRHLEIIIVDGVSTDDTLKIVNDYAVFIPINFISEEDSGIYYAMNKGIEMAKGEWVYFIGSDDQLHDREVLDKVAANLTADVDIVYGDSIWMPEQVNEEGEWVYSKLLNQSINHQRIFYRRSLFKRLGSLNTSYKIWADYAMNIRFFCEPSVKLKYINLPIAYYHSGGFSANKTDEIFWDNWETVMLKNFTPYLPQKQIYKNLGWYCWYNLNRKKYRKAANIFFKVFFHTFSISFLKHTLSQARKTIIN